MTDIYHTYGRCDSIFDIYDDTLSVKDSEGLQRASVAPVELSSFELTTLLHKDMTTFWPSNKKKFHLETVVQAAYSTYVVLFSIQYSTILM